MWERKTHDRDGMWEMIRQLRTFTHRQIKTATGHDRRTIGQYLDALTKGGYLTVSSRPPRSKYSHGKEHQEKVYTLVRDIGRQRPLIDDDGKPLPPTSRQRMWVALKVVGTKPFDWRDLAFAARADVQDAREYCTYLCHAGYLRVVKKAKPGTPTVYLLDRRQDTGPRAPELRKRKTEMYDVNRRELVWKKGHVRAFDPKSGKTVWVEGGAE